MLTYAFAGLEGLEIEDDRLAGFAVIGSITCAVFAVETRGKVLEIISPPL